MLIQLQILVTIRSTLKPALLISFSSFNIALIEIDKAISPTYRHTTGKSVRVHDDVRRNAMLIKG